MKKVCFETFGCRLSRAEALQQEAEYLAKGWKTTEKHSEADLIIVRGCSVTARAQSDCEKFIAHLKERYPETKLEIVGCLKKSEVEGAILAAEERKSPDFPACDAPVPLRTARAYLKVQDGCSGRCTFCIVPKFRGASSSCPFDSALDRAKRFIEAGYRELVVTGCNLSLYASGGRRFAELVDALAALDSGTRVRVGSIEPGSAAEELVDVMSARANVCRFLHIPVQSGSNRILSAMRRPYLVKDVDALVSKAVKAMPLVGIGCDLMTGFPGETEVDFAMTRGLARRLAFSNYHIFPFSERPGTIAAGLPGAVPRETRHARAHELQRIAVKRREEYAAKFIGAEVEMLVEDEKNRAGWTGEYFGCRVTTIRNQRLVKRKQLVKVHVMTVHGDTLHGVVL